MPCEDDGPSPVSVKRHHRRVPEAVHGGDPEFLVWRTDTELQEGFRHQEVKCLVLVGQTPLNSGRAEGCVLVHLCVCRGCLARARQCENTSRGLTSLGTAPSLSSDPGVFRYLLAWSWLLRNGSLHSCIETDPSAMWLPAFPHPSLGHSSLGLCHCLEEGWKKVGPAAIPVIWVLMD